MSFAASFEASDDEEGSNNTLGRLLQQLGAREVEDEEFLDMLEGLILGDVTNGMDDDDETAVPKTVKKR